MNKKCWCGDPVHVGKKADGTPSPKKLCSAHYAKHLKDANA